MFFYKLKTKNNKKLKIIDSSNFYYRCPQNDPTSHPEERLVNVVRGSECFVCLSIFLVYAEGPPAPNS